MPKPRYDRIGRNHTVVTVLSQTTIVRLYDTDVFKVLRLAPGVKLVTLDCGDWHTQTTYRRIRQSWNVLVGEYPYQIRLGRRVVMIYQVGCPVLVASLDNPVSIEVRNEGIKLLDYQPFSQLATTVPKSDLFD